MVATPDLATPEGENSAAMAHASTYDSWLKINMERDSCRDEEADGGVPTHECMGAWHAHTATLYPGPLQGMHG